MVDLPLKCNRHYRRIGVLTHSAFYYSTVLAIRTRMCDGK